MTVPIGTYQCTGCSRWFDSSEVQLQKHTLAPVPICPICNSYVEHRCELPLDEFSRPVVQGPKPHRSSDVGRGFTPRREKEKKNGR